MPIISKDRFESLIFQRASQMKKIITNTNIFGVHEGNTRWFDLCLNCVNIKKDHNKKSQDRVDIFFAEHYHKFFALDERETLRACYNEIKHQL